AIKEYFPSDFVTRSSNHVSVKLTDPKMLEQFETGKRKAIEESRTLARLDDIENVTDVYDCFEENNTAYIVMEYLEGITLKDLLKQKGKLTYEQAVNLIFPVINSLEKVHRQNLIHRDISPDNIFLCSDGKIKILDFGSARYALNHQEKTYTIVLKHGYAPVEQYSARSAQGPWTDVYAVAATFYRMITGVKPLNSFERVNNDTMKSPKELGVQLPDYVDDAIMKALCVDSKFRTQDMTEFKRDLSGAVQRQNRYKDELYKDRPIRQYTPNPSENDEKSKAGLIVAIAAILISVIVIAAVLIFAKKGSDETEVTTSSQATTLEEKTVATTAPPTTAEPETTTEPETTAAPDPSMKLVVNGEEADRITVAYIETLSLVLENIPEDAGDIKVEIEDEEIVSVNVVGNLLSRFIPMTEFSVTFTGKSKGSTTATFYLENYPEVSLSVPVDVILTIVPERTTQEE
ncbi:MAG: serine/threonine protein kinase, partial [Clostridia bacterium]|nr:serine/threonine protein kinase [Clostridia bacterium]